MPGFTCLTQRNRKYAINGSNRVASSSVAIIGMAFLEIQSSFFETKILFHFQAWPFYFKLGKSLHFAILCASSSQAKDTKSTEKMDCLGSQCDGFHLFAELEREDS